MEGVSPYVGFRMGCIGWNCGGPLIGSKTTKNSSKSSRVDKIAAAHQQLQQQQKTRLINMNWKGLIYIVSISHRLQSVPKVCFAGQWGKRSKHLVYVLGVDWCNILGVQARGSDERRLKSAKYPQNTV